jgi:hypothetical protein
MNEIKQTPTPQYDNLLNSSTLLNVTTASAILMFVQSALQDKNISGSLIANLQMGAYHMLYSIRESNANTKNEQSTPEAQEISNNIHKELYYYDYQINRLLEEFIIKQDKSVKREYINSIEVCKRLKPLISSEI